ncbi:MAG: glycerophosphodiester phosphodiesterase [Microbacterium sp. SCN 70-200]|uniref:glycerophosphodiester phosphodiesterase family protein n=1 Tax=unclassified Microbacterium TaxID=2609290 RepID=UPI00086BEC31|nr:MULTISPECIES: glycerophosphodiester phosphodiesterase family protein [unclassified Microbacterium]MBN9215755.1 glycerophosphodiester phosphodiesterase [Microbacterium sp.]ODT39959.1 MAG: glycerophosphodiester phosphodiesterase [Microbacterium sp. SCN 70-200]OJV81984.1 MAG: glycerophosphodiester phosphodiesterase [Microbacterium sp. 70-16]
MPRRRPLVIGHRGAPGYRPEHTRSSYDLALALGVDAVEPDVVFTSDGILVVRHENEIGSTTNVADHPEFADRRTTKTIDGDELTGWFTEDFTWGELSTLRCRERLPQLRRQSATFDDAQPPLRLSDLLDLVRQASLDQGREIGVVLEIKHATYFAGLGYDVAGTIAAELRAAHWADGELPLVLESFESTVLAQVRAQGVRGSYIYLLEASGHPYDLAAAAASGTAAAGKTAAPTYREQASPAGLDALVGAVDGISLDKRMILAPDRLGRTAGPSRVVADAHDRGLRVFTWTCRPENKFLIAQFRRGRDKSAFGDYEAEWQVIADAGVDGVFVDHADLGVAFFRDRIR